MSHINTGCNMLKVYNKFCAMQGMPTGPLLRSSPNKPPKNNNNPTRKNSLFLRKWNFLAVMLKNSCISINEALHLASSLKMFPCFSRKKFFYFLIFLEMRPCTFQSKLKKEKKSTWRKFLTLQETESLKNLVIFFSKESFSSISGSGNSEKMPYNS